MTINSLSTVLCIATDNVLYSSRTSRKRETVCLSSAPSVTAASRTPQRTGSRPPPPPSGPHRSPQACEVRLNILFRISLFVRCFIAHSCWHILFIYSPLKAGDINLPTFLERLHYLQCLRCCAHCARSGPARCLSLHCPVRLCYSAHSIYCTAAVLYCLRYNDRTTNTLLHFERTV